MTLLRLRDAGAGPIMTAGFFVPVFKRRALRPALAAAAGLVQAASRPGTRARDRVGDSSLC
jgi:hypothetical protein